MVREVIAIGDTVELAIEAGCRELNLETHEVQFDIIDMPVKKTLGLFGGNPAKVRVYVEISPAETAANYLKSVLEAMDAPSVNIEIEETDGGAILSINGDGLGFIIGRHGETLNALQYLSGLVANNMDSSYYRITLNMGNYREKREKTLHDLAKKMAAKCIKYGRNLKLEPMNPYERRIIHTAIQEIDGVKSWSEGQEMDRHVVIGPESGERQFTPRPRTGSRAGNRRPYNNDNRGGRSSQNRSSNYRTPHEHRDTPKISPAAEDKPASTVVRTKSTTESSAGHLYGRIDVKKNVE